MKPLWSTPGQRTRMLARAAAARAAARRLRMRDDEPSNEIVLSRDFQIAALFATVRIDVAALLAQADPPPSEAWVAESTNALMRRVEARIAAAARDGGI